MADRLRQYAHAHWAALDAAFSRTCAPGQLARCRDGVRWSLADIAAKYATRLIDPAGDDGHSLGIETVGRELATALDAAWSSAQNRRP